jgi:hypothetical protein
VTRDDPVYANGMADHRFPAGDTKCAVCGIPAKDAHRESCIKRVLDFPIPGEKLPLRADRKPRK